MIELKPIFEGTREYEEIERKIKELFKREIYLPLLREIGETSRAIQNARSYLVTALNTGRVTYSSGRFSGKFNAGISKELRALGAKFDRIHGVYKISERTLPMDIRGVISASHARFQEKIEKIDQKLAQILPDELASKLKVEAIFDQTIYKTEKAFQKSVQDIAVSPLLTETARERIAQKWAENMNLWIQDFTKTEILALRKSVQESVFSGNRYESLVKAIQTSYAVTENKAKFLARQETSLLVAKLKQTRYQEAGIDYYKWGCVSGTKNHPVRPAHKRLDGKIFRWDTGAIVSEPGEPERRCNPKQDYNCRCFARPLVGYKGK